MTRQTELDRRWYDTGYEDMGIGFKHEPFFPDLDYDAHNNERDQAMWNSLKCSKKGLAHDQPTQQEEERRDQPHAARGCLIGCIMGLIMWVLIIWGAYEWLK